MNDRPPAVLRRPKRCRSACAASSPRCRSGGGFPDGLRPILDAYRDGRRDEAIAGYERWLPLINIENRQCGFLAAKALMKEGGFIDCEAPRAPWPPINPHSRALLIETAQRLGALALRWGR